MPNRQDIEKHAEKIKEINPSEVIAMLQVLQAAAEIQHQILDVLDKEYQISEGKLQVMINLHQETRGLSPSELADKVGVTRATISIMLKKMVRDGLVQIVPDMIDGRVKKVQLTEKGCRLMEEVLPPHYMRITRLMRKLSEAEQEELIRILNKIITA